MKRVLIFLCLALSGPAHATREVRGPVVVANGLQSIKHYLGLTPVPPPQSWESIVGFGPWLKLWENYAGEGVRTPDARERGFVAHAEDLVREGLSLKRLYRLAFPDREVDFTDPVKLIFAALSPFPSGLSDIRFHLIEQARETRWVGVEESYQGELGPTSDVTGACAKSLDASR